jgi:hypothetical protein
MAQHGQHQEALHAMWLQMSVTAQGCLQRNDPAELAAGAALMQRWLQRTGFAGAEVLAARLQQAELLLRQVELR